MDADALRQLRQVLSLTQQDMARALSVSFVTYSRWENGHRAVPSDAAKLLDGLRALLGKTAGASGDLTVQDIREAVQAAGVAGVVSNAAVARMLPESLILSLAVIPNLAWLAGAVGIGVVGGLAFFRKSSARRSRGGEPNMKGDPDE